MEFDLKNIYIGDIECTGFLEEMEGVESDLHVLGVSYLGKDGLWKVKTTNSKEDVKRVFEDPNNTVLGHNFYMFDIPALEKIFKDINIKATILDSLFIAWYIEPNRIKEGKKYGLGDYGEEFGVKKTAVDSNEWVGLDKNKKDIINYYEGLVRGSI